MKQTGDLHFVKKMNKALVLDYLHDHSPISRTHIAKRTGLTKATVSNLVQEWIDCELVNEVGAGPSSGGRKPMMLWFNQTAGYAIGVDLGVNYITAAVFDLQGTLLKETRAIHENKSLEHVMSLMKSVIQELISHTPASPYGIIGIGIGIPGICDGLGNVLFAPNLGWKDIPLKMWIEDEFHVPVIVDNEANAGALGEYQYSLSKEVDNLIYLSMSIGIGAGLVMRGELYRGMSGFSGEIGHMSIMYDGPLCRCGNRGCWELFASEQAIIDKAYRVYGKRSNQESISLELLIALAEQGDQIAIELFHELGCSIGVGIVGIIHSFNPQYVILGGRLLTAEKWLAPAIHDTIEQRSMSFPRHRLQVQFSTLQARSTLLGACSLVITQFLTLRKSS
jgi:glucokinase-like ROK family protein